MNSRIISLNGLSKHSRSDQETRQIGAQFGKTLPKGSVICIYGDLGAGKTTFAKGFIEELTGDTEVTSPTFTYVQQYGAVSHFDLYRLDNPEQFTEKGLDEYIQNDGFTLIEWPEKARGFLPKNTVEVVINHE
ncbi:MAG: tRNA threonylcarbamoyladenosine biosynthesis protein TsaE [Chlamydiia bacterium]|nr:tRNA threonylcarbamoyladenosine biosynthesis protein TsaE [Chlamydiia bacterium]MCH9616489.1 tRNA threonylcarbamoyladenosine biosynthesis protein TsaE [Chlamydiia bacterium]MCH9629525.1 tRNA threonylcarbamoyladenosine biosynthesis protein TsaE [Chlamydiia bacterium]